MTIEVRMTDTAHGRIRHYVVSGHEIALCGVLTARAPRAEDRHAYLCRSCDRLCDRANERK